MQETSRGEGRGRNGKRLEAKKEWRDHTEISHSESHAFWIWLDRGRTGNGQSPEARVKKQELEL